MACLATAIDKVVLPLVKDVLLDTQNNFAQGSQLLCQFEATKCRNELDFSCDLFQCEYHLIHQEVSNNPVVEL